MRARRRPPSLLASAGLQAINWTAAHATVARGRLVVPASAAGAFFLGDEAD
jgi:hypothetical protein